VFGLDDVTKGEHHVPSSKFSDPNMNQFKEEE